MGKNISGNWTFNEEFECGIDKGFAFITQNNEQLNGYLEYEEFIEGEPPFKVMQMFSGTINDNKIHLVGIGVTNQNGESIPDYNLDTLEGVLTYEGKIVGHSFDCNDICGVFVMERMIE